MTQGRTGAPIRSDGLRAWVDRLRRWPSEAGQERDWALMALLGLLNVGSLFTTVLGAQQLLPSPMAEILGISIQAMLFTMLAGFAGQHAPVRKWLVVAVFASACIYCSFFTYYRELGKAQDDERLLANAQERHADLVQAVFAEAKIESESLEREAAALDRQAQDEARRGTSTGVTGYGPRAKQMRTEANAKALAAERQLAIVEQLEPLFTFPMDGMTPKQVFDRDLAAWQAAPAELRGDTPRPVYDDYVDESVQVGFLAPFNRVRQGDTVATVSLGLASLVDGMAILLGTAIQRRQRKPLVRSGAHNVAALVRDVKAGYGKVIDALSMSEHDQDMVVLHVPDGVSFLTDFYEAIHPENGYVEFDGLKRKDSHTRLAARVLLDRLLSRDWVVKRDGAFHVEDKHYHALTAWLAAQIALARRESPADVGSGPAPLELELPWSSGGRPAS